MAFDPTRFMDGLPQIKPENAHKQGPVISMNDEQENRKRRADKNRIFSVSELWGPMKCEVEGCKSEAWSIILTPEENALLPEPSGPEAVKFLFRTGTGKVRCDEHIK